MLKGRLSLTTGKGLVLCSGSDLPAPFIPTAAQPLGQTASCLPPCLPCREVISADLTCQEPDTGWCETQDGMGPSKEGGLQAAGSPRLLWFYKAFSEILHYFEKNIKSSEICYFQIKRVWNHLIISFLPSSLPVNFQGAGELLGPAPGCPSQMLPGRPPPPSTAAAKTMGGTRPTLKPEP